MTPETILRSDVLDIIFENRNKQYGAYTLRREYGRRLGIAVSTMLLSVLALVLFSFFKAPAPKTISVKDFNIADSLKLTEIKPPLEKPLPKPELPKPPATIKNPTPIIVPDPLATDTMHTMEEMEDKIISTVTTDGPPATDIVQPTSGTGTSTAITPAPEPAPEPAVLLTAEVMPEYPGGLNALIRFLSRNLTVPEEAMEQGQRVKVPVKFVVNKDGDLSDIEFLVTPKDEFKKEIMRVMNKMPKWKPGIQNGKTVAVYYTIPIIFEMPE